MISKIFNRKLIENKENIFIDLDKKHWAYDFIINSSAL
jgi:hypothetical protein